MDLEKQKRLQVITNYVTIFGIILAMVTLIITVSIFKSEINYQNNEQIDKHIANIRSTRFELRLIDAGINILINKANSSETQTNYYQFPLINLERLSADGDLRNETLKLRVLALYNELLQQNRALQIGSSSELSIFVNEGKFTRQSFYKGITDKMSFTHIEILSLDRDLESYSFCVINKRIFEKC